ncbi:ABC transporter permease [Leucobacter sp. wl10]|uniref:ABC transporter permease n=1 Tax=Leucobacter sp. wl10 TaxID=2304677 RepID=UPI0013C3700F|nr:ABC transporter permease subunit [Leucobacter sp. wl10]
MGRSLADRTVRAAGWAAVGVALLGAVLPLLFSVSYAFTRNDGAFTLDGLSALTELESSLGRALSVTAVITVGTVVLMLGTLLPILIVVHVWRPGWRPVIETITTIPLVVPTIALAAGIVAMLRWGAQQGRGSWQSSISQALQNTDFPILLIGTYTVLCLPFAFRALDSGLRTLPLKSFFEASQSLGGNTFRTLVRIVIPSLKQPVMYSSFFAIALSIGEFTVAATLNQQTLPVWIFVNSSQDFRGSIALSLMSTALTWLLLILATVAAGRAGRAGRARPPVGIRSEAAPAPSPTATREEALV